MDELRFKCLYCSAGAFCGPISQMALINFFITAWQAPNILVLYLVTGEAFHFQPSLQWKNKLLLYLVKIDQLNITASVSIHDVSLDTNWVTEEREQELTRLLVRLSAPRSEYCIYIEFLNDILYNYKKKKIVDMTFWNHTNGVLDKGKSAAGINLTSGKRDRIKACMIMHLVP